MNKEQFLRGMTFLGTAYKTGFTEEEVEVWYQMLKDYQEEDFNKAIKELIKTEKYPPSIAQITEHIAKSHFKALPNAESEWVRVIDTVHSFGSYKEEEALNSLCEYTRKIVKLIGYYKICTATQEEQVWNKKEFISEYNSLISHYTETLMLENKERNMING